MISGAKGLVTSPTTQNLSIDAELREQCLPVLHLLADLFGS